MTKIAILGTGRMGSALAQTLLEHRHDVTVWNRTRERAGPLLERGARLANSPREAVAAADVIVGILNDYATSDLLLRAADVTSALRGKLFVQLTSGSPEQARATAAWAREHGIRYVDGAIMTTPDKIGTPESLILYAGERAVFDQAAPPLAALGTQAFAGPDVGHAAALDSALLMVMWGVLFGTLQGTAISQAEGVSLEDFLGHVQALVPVLGDFSGQVIQRAIRSDYEQTQATLETHHAALQHVLDICRQRGLDRTLPDAFDRVMRSGRERGHSNHDFAALVSILR